MSGLQCGDLLRVQLDTGKDENRAYKNTADRADGVEGLREVQATF